MGITHFWLRIRDVCTVLACTQEESEEEEETEVGTFYCVACEKRFKSEKQLKNHETWVLTLTQKMVFLSALAAFSSESAHQVEDNKVQ